MSANVDRYFFLERDAFLGLRFEFLVFGVLVKSLGRSGVARPPGVLIDGACNSLAIHEGHEFTRRAALRPVRSGQVLSSRVTSIFPAVGDGRSCCLLATDDRMPDGFLQGFCVVRSWFSVSCSLLLQPVVDISVAHLKAICAGFSLLSAPFIIFRHERVVLALSTAEGPSCCCRRPGDVLCRSRCPFWR